MVTREAVIEALRHVQEPELDQDLITLNMVKDMRWKTIRSASPSCWRR
jgi:ATP-binding protein involved in chromosome partitioning